MNTANILILDDSPQILYTLEQICRFQKWTPLLSQNFNTAMNFIKNDSIDLIIIDYHMPDGDYGSPKNKSHIAKYTDSRAYN